MGAEDNTVLGPPLSGTGGEAGTGTTPGEGGDSGMFSEAGDDGTAAGQGGQGGDSLFRGGGGGGGGVTVTNASATPGVQEGDGQILLNYAPGAPVACVVVATTIRFTG